MKEAAARAADRHNDIPRNADDETRRPPANGGASSTGDDLGKRRVEQSGMPAPGMRGKRRATCPPHSRVLNPTPSNRAESLLSSIGAAANN